MAGSLNKVMVIGNVGRDPEMRYLQNGTPVTNFSVAASHSWTSPDGEKREETEWFSIVAWNKLAEVCNQLVSKGRKVYIEGRLRTHSWEAQDGTKKYRTEVVASTMILLDKRPQSAVADDTESVPGQAPVAGPDESGFDDIPF